MRGLEFETVVKLLFRKFFNLCTIIIAVGWYNFTQKVSFTTLRFECLLYFSMKKFSEIKNLEGLVLLAKTLKAWCDIFL